MLNRWNLGNPTDLQFSPDGQSIALALHDTIDVRAWRGDSMATVSGLKEVRSVAFSPTGTTLVAGLYDRTVRFWGGLTDAGGAASDSRILKGPAAPVLTVAYSNDGTVVASAGDDKVIRLWDPDTGEQRGVLAGHVATVNCVQFSQDGRLLACAGNDFTVRIWRATLVTESTDAPNSD